MIGVKRGISVQRIGDKLIVKSILNGVCRERQTFFYGY